MDSSSSWERYPAIKETFGEKWLKNPNNKDHPLFTHYDETDYLNSLNEYLDFIGKLRKATIDHLKNKTQFFDTYSELEVAHFLKKIGLTPKLSEMICGKEADIFLEEDKLVINIKNLHVPQKIQTQAKRFIPKSKVHDVPEAVDVTFLHMERMLSSLTKKGFQNVYPNIICFCPEIAGDCQDLKKLIERHKISENVSALAIWKHQKILCLFDNPSGKKLKLTTQILKRFFNLS